MIDYMKYKLRKFVFSIGCWSQWQIEISAIRLATTEFTVSFSQLFLDIDEKTLHITLSEWTKLSDAIIKSGVLKWKKEYYAPVLDGVSWMLKMEYDSDSDGPASFFITGNNAYPASWDKFVSALQNINFNDPNITIALARLTYKNLAERDGLC